MLRGDIDCYSEYSGTLVAEIFSNEAIHDRNELKAALAREGAWSSDPLGFDNTYVLGMRRTRAGELGIANMSDLRAHPELQAAQAPA